MEEREFVYIGVEDTDEATLLLIKKLTEAAREIKSNFTLEEVEKLSRLFLNVLHVESSAPNLFRVLLVHLEKFEPGKVSETSTQIKTEFRIDEFTELVSTCLALRGEIGRTKNGRAQLEMFARKNVEASESAHAA